MTERDNSLDLDGLAYEAREWVRRIASGDATADDTEALMRWRSLSASHAQALGRAAQQRRRMLETGQALRADPATRWLASVPSRAPQAAPSIGRRGFLIGGGAVAASAVAVAVVRPPLGLWPSLAQLRADYHTGTGEHRTIEVAQGLSVELNTRTSLAQRNDAQTWRLALISGEVAINARRPAKPAAITTDDGAALASEGRFSVRVGDRGTCVTCFAGQVAVNDTHDRHTLLDEGSQLMLSKAGGGEIVKIDVARAEAWRRGELVFIGQPLSEVVEELNRYRRGKIILTNAELGRFPVNAIFRLNGLDRAVTQISEVANASVTSLPGGIVVLS